MVIVVASTKKKKGWPYKSGMNRLKSYKSSNLLLWKIIVEKTFSTTATRLFQLPTFPTTGEFSHQHLLTIRNQCSTLPNLNSFSLCRKRCATSIKTKSLPMILQSLQFILFGVQKMTLYQIVVTTSKTPFLLMTLCTLLMGITSLPMLILTMVLLFTLKLLQKSDRSTHNGIKIPEPVKNPSVFPATINITFLILCSIALKNFWTPTSNGIWFQQL